MAKKKVIFIIGPTAIGKTGLAVKLAGEINGEIISADSMQAYKGIDLLSQKPTRREQKCAQHHLISFLRPEEEYSAATFSKKANKIIESLLKKDKIPIVVGGSGLYVKALLDGIFPSSGKDEKLREKLTNLAKKKGSYFLHRRLEKIDPASARGIHPNDCKRVIRALEIYELENKTKSKLKVKTKGIKDKYDIGIFGLTKDRKALYKKIDERVNFMFKKGVVREVKNFLKHKLSITSKQALGIKQINGYMNRDYDLERAKELLKRDTRRFAKRQFTWFKKDKRIEWLDISKISHEEAINKIRKDMTL